MARLDARVFDAYNQMDTMLENVLSGDAAGATALSFTAFWVNRNNAPHEEIGVAPDHVLVAQNELPDFLAGRRIG